MDTDSLYESADALSSLYESDLDLLLLAHPMEHASLLASLRPHLMDSDLRALEEVLLDLHARMGRKF